MVKINLQNPCHKTRANLHCIKGRNLIFQVAVVYFISCVTHDNTVAAHKNGRVPPGVNPSKFQPPPPIPEQPTAQKDEIKFHDPNDFAEGDNLQQPQQNIHQQQINEQNLNKAPEAKLKLGDGGKPHAPHPHQAHGHGIGESVDAEHMKEHEKEEFVDFSKMTQPQIIMHHFRQFDQNKDGKVDGLEMFKKIQRDNDAHVDGDVAKSKEVIQDEMDRLAETVDLALNAYDENNDGYIYYGEFFRAHTKADSPDIKDGVEP